MCGRFATVFNGMVARLQATQQDLEAQVIDRTRELRSLSARQEAILTAVSDIIVEVDVHKVYTWANRAGYDFFGEDLIGRSAAAYFEGEQNTMKIIQPLFEGAGKPIYVESWQRRKDGEIRLLAWWCSELKDAQGHVTSLISTGRDITASRQAEESLKQNYTELARFNQLTVGRELRMIGLKKEINALLEESGKPPAYRIVTDPS